MTVLGPNHSPTDLPSATPMLAMKHHKQLTLIGMHACTIAHAHKALAKKHVILVLSLALS